MPLGVSYDTVAHHSNNLFLLQDGWAPLRTFLGLEKLGEDEDFPHKNKRSHGATIFEELFVESEYRKRYIKDLNDYLNKFGLSVTETKK